MSRTRRRKSNTLVVPQAAYALELLKYEVAQEHGIEIPPDGYYGHMMTRDMGRLGGNITKRLIQIAQQSILENK
ncbi:alpha/beta-type small acid-soluble spore protein (plasmid) [Paenibacillus thiaminolyticus]|uniref:alpha/beta-type small acid-soluble spore protein n=1 Tax=Paenibacillus thiaminolyticus TaxID=49283 RepID=UPI00232DEB16|nr:alpha/beta-type small acid-soluble spore protein [Paenibacillus thiaminolyticus]WCF11547.1 alpha/beta-type small acid-soluble spore protein [Paenibacillus thiaminolyticus]